jgi:hypothetical protein
LGGKPRDARQSTDSDSPLSDACLPACLQEGKPGLHASPRQGRAEKREKRYAPPFDVVIGVSLGCAAVGYIC